MTTLMKTMLLAGAAMALASGAQAATVVFGFGTIPDTLAQTTGDLGQMATFTVSGLSVTASAFGPSLGGVPDHLYGKGNGGNENGLGMTNDPTGNHEIYFGKGFIQLDLNALKGKVKTDAIYASFNSTTGGEQWKIYGSNVAGALASATLPTPDSLIATGTNSQGVNTLLTGGFRYYDFVSTVAQGGTSGGNVLIKNLTVTTVPEPDTWALMIAGFGGLGAMLRRRRAQTATA